MRQIKIKVEKVQKRQARKLQRAASLVWSKQKFLYFLKSYLILEIRCTDTWSEFLQERTPRTIDCTQSK